MCVCDLYLCRCPSFLSWACDLVSAIGDALESVLASLGIPSIDDILKTIFEAVGLEIPDFGLPGLKIFDAGFGALINPITAKKDAMLNQVKTLGQSMQPR